MLNFHFSIKRSDLRHRIEIIFKQISLKHSGKIFRYLFSFLYTLYQSYMEANLQIISNFSNIRHVDIIFMVLVIFSELELAFLGEEEFEEEVKNFLILF